MTTITISIPEEQKGFVDARMKQAGFGDPSEYFLALIRADQKLKDQEHLEELLLEGIASESSEMTPQDWADLRREVLKRIHTESR